MFRYYMGRPKSRKEILNCGVNNTIKLLYIGLVLRSYLLLGGHFSNSRSFAHTNAVFDACIGRLSLLGGHLHLAATATL